MDDFFRSERAELRFDIGGAAAADGLDRAAVATRQTAGEFVTVGVYPLLKLSECGSVHLIAIGAPAASVDRQATQLSLCDSSL